MEFVELKMNKNKTISYVCMLCNYETTRKSNLVKHFTSKKHKRKLEEKEENAIRQATKIIKQSIKKEPHTKYKFSCSCGKTFKHQSSLSRHKRCCKENAKFNSDEEDYDEDE